MSATLAPPPVRSAEPSGLPNGYVTAEEYLHWEEFAETKHEWIDGEVREVPGASKPHCKLGWKINLRLGLLFESKPYEGFSSDIKVRVPDGPYYYCDGSLAFAPSEFEPPIRPGGPETVLTNPAVIVEILSDGTAHIDRGEKLAGYRTIPSLTDYLLFSQNEPHVVHHRRPADGDWAEETHRGRDAVLTLAAGAATLRLDGIYKALDGLAG